MDLKNIVQLVGGYHHVEVSPDAHLDLGADITIHSFTSIEVSSGANLKVGNRVFLMTIVQSAVLRKSPLVMIQCLGMEYEFLIRIINSITIMCLKLQ